MKSAGSKVEGWWGIQYSQLYKYEISVHSTISIHTLHIELRAITTHSLTNIRQKFRVTEDKIEIIKQLCCVVAYYEHGNMIMAAIFTPI